jgi:small redox-active disulfide protein 2
MEIKILGPGCYNCQKLEELVNDAVKELKINAKIDKVTDMLEIMQYTMSTPGLIINGKLKHSGRPLPTLEKDKELLKSEA